jgi:hypothetical protein
MNEYVYLVVGRIVDSDNLLNPFDFGSFLCDRLDVASSDKAMDRSPDLLGCSDCTQRSVIQLAIALFENG